MSLEASDGVLPLLCGKLLGVIFTVSICSFGILTGDESAKGDSTPNLVLKTHTNKKVLLYAISISD